MKRAVSLAAILATAACTQSPGGEAPPPADQTLRMISGGVTTTVTIKDSAVSFALTAEGHDPLTIGPIEAEARDLGILDALVDSADEYGCETDGMHFEPWNDDQPCRTIIGALMNIADHDGAFPAEAFLTYTPVRESPGVEVDPEPRPGPMEGELNVTGPEVYQHGITWEMTGEELTDYLMTLARYMASEPEACEGESVNLEIQNVSGPVSNETVDLCPGSEAAHLVEILAAVTARTPTNGQ